MVTFCKCFVVGADVMQYQGAEFGQLLFDAQSSWKHPGPGWHMLTAMADCAMATKLRASVAAPGFALPFGLLFPFFALLAFPLLGVLSTEPAMEISPALVPYIG